MHGGEEDERLDEVDERVDAQELGVVYELLDVAVVDARLRVPRRLDLLLGGAARRRQHIRRYEGKEGAEETRRRLGLLNDDGRLVLDERDLAARMQVVLALDEHLGQELGLVELHNAVEYVPPAVAQYVAVVVRELEDGLARQLRLVVHAEAHRQLIAHLAANAAATATAAAAIRRRVSTATATAAAASGRRRRRRRRREGRELAQGDDDVVEHVAHHVVGGHLGALAETVDGLLDDAELVALVVDERERRDGLAPHDVEYVLVVGAGGRVHVVRRVARLAAPYQHLPQVVVAQQARVLGRHDDLLGAHGRVDLLEERLVEVGAAVDVLQVLLELLDDHGRALLLHVVVVLIDVEHDDCVGEREGGVVVDELAVVAGAPVGGEVLEHERDERRLARQAEGLEEHAQRFVDAQAGEAERLDEELEYGRVLTLAEVLAELLLVESGRLAQVAYELFAEESRRVAGEDAVVLEELDGLGRTARVEEVDALVDEALLGAHALQLVATRQLVHVDAHPVDARSHACQLLQVMLLALVLLLFAAARHRVRHRVLSTI